MKYAVCYTHVTNPQHSVDGKRHTRTLYYGGCIDFGLGECSQWVRKNKALLFDRKTEANKIARRYSNHKDIHVVEIGGKKGV